jgi:hypothetical protein
MGISHRPAAITIDAAPWPAARGLAPSLSPEFDASHHEHLALLTRRRTEHWQKSGGPFA